MSQELQTACELVAVVERYLRDWKQPLGWMMSMMDGNMKMSSDLGQYEGEG